MWFFYLIVLMPILLMFLLFALDYYVFFWGNYLFYLVGCIISIGSIIYELKSVISDLKQRKIYSLKISNPINSIKKNGKSKLTLKDKQIFKHQKIKYANPSIKSVFAKLICVIIIGFISKILIEEFYVMSLDLPYVINKNYTQISCKVQESKRSSMKYDHYSQYISVITIYGSIKDIEFGYKYDTILEGKNYDIWYLPNSSLGFKAEPIKELDR
ncbi:MAG TPA: hypothetical protein VIM70_18810 [Clostridium sp.]|uniref:hypothetical protein n=1 Tax=Clostridium sp. TaxID=1506 RepID=UPI002F93392E